MRSSFHCFHLITQLYDYFLWCATNYREKTVQVQPFILVRLVFKGWILYNDGASSEKAKNQNQGRCQIMENINLNEQKELFVLTEKDTKTIEVFRFAYQAIGSDGLPLSNEEIAALTGLSMEELYSILEEISSNLGYYCLLTSLNI